MSWKDKLHFLKCKPVRHEINGEPVDFYPVSGAFLFRLQGIAGPLAQAIAALFADTSHDYEIAQRQFGEDGTEGSEFVQSAVTPEMAETRHRQRAEAIEKIMHALSSEQNRDLVAELIMASISDEYLPQDQQPPAGEFLRAVSGPVLREMLVGVAKANKGLLGPLAQQLEQAASHKMTELKDRVSTWEQKQDAATETATDGMSSENSSSPSPNEPASA